jgi:hypothetical protein
MPTVKSSAKVIKTQESPVRFDLKMPPDVLRALAPKLEDIFTQGGEVEVSITYGKKKRTDAQLKFYWANVPELLLLATGRWPTKEECESYHDENKFRHGNRRPSLINPEILVPAGFSDGDREDASALIDGLFEDLSQLDLDMKGQLNALESWKEYWRLGGQKYKNESDFRARAKLCAACGKGGVIELAHMESRGANPARKDDPTNWVPLCRTCHSEQHTKGVKIFLRSYPHLAMRWESSREVKNGA